nr:polyprenol phosphomannose-dependent alpha 1,6 mannosyltransferase MptB [Acidimicrobiia bacterium]
LPGSQPFVGVLAMRALALAGVALLAWAVPRLAERLGQDPADAAVLVVANPLVLVHLVAGAHNEAMLAGFLAAGFAAAAGGRRYLGVALSSIGGVVKLPGLVGAVVLGWGADEGTPVRTRLTHTAVAGAVCIATIASCSLVTGLGFGWVGSSVAPGLVISWAAPTNWLGSLIGLDLAQDIGLAVAGVLAAWWTWRAGPADAAATGKILVALAVLGPALHPWYLLWGFPLLAAAAAGRPNRLLVAASIVGVFAGHLGSGPFIERVGDEPVALLVGAVVVLVAMAATSRDVRAVVVEGSEGRGEGRNPAATPSPAP